MCRAVRGLVRLGCAVHAWVGLVRVVRAWMGDTQDGRAWMGCMWEGRDGWYSKFDKLELNKHCLFFSNTDI